MATTKPTALSSQQTTIPLMIAGGLLTTTLESPPDHKIVRVIGVVYGLSVRTRNCFIQYGMALKGLAGGELESYSKMLHRLRNDAVDRLCKEARACGANAIIGMRFEAGDLSSRTGVKGQCCAYGTACIVESSDSNQPKPPARAMAPVRLDPPENQLAVAEPRPVEG